MHDNYLDPLNKFFALGRPEGSMPEEGLTYEKQYSKYAKYADRLTAWPDYVDDFDLTEAHLPDLIRLLAYDIFDEQDDWDEKGFATVHAWRALGQLRATEAIEPLLALMLADEWDDWGWEDLPHALALIGEPVLQPLSQKLAQQASEYTTGLTSTLERIGNYHLDLREQCADILLKQLESFRDNNETMNAFMIHTLTEWQVERALPVMEEAFKRNRVDLSLRGDWHDVQVDFGLAEPRPPEPTLEERIRQNRISAGLPPEPESEADEDYLDLSFLSPATQEDINRERKLEKETEKRRNKRKAAKKARQRNNKKKKKKK